MKFLSASRTQTRHLSCPLRVEWLEDRVQPGSVVPWPAWSDLDASLSDLERDSRRLRNETTHAAQFRLLDQEAAQPFGVLFSPSATEPGGLRSASAPTAPSDPMPSVTQPTLDLARVAATQGVRTTPLTPTQAPGVRTGTPIMATSVRTGVSQPSGLTLQLQPAAATEIDLQASPEWFNRPVEFKVVQHLHRDTAGPEAMLNWSTYLTGATEAATARSVTLDALGNSYTTGWIEVEGDNYGFVVKYDPSGAGIYGTVFAAQDNLFQYRSTEPGGIAVDSEGNAYIGGTALRSTGTITDGFALKLDPSGAEVVYGYTHGLLARPTVGTGIAVDSVGRAYVTGNNLPAGYAFPHVFIGRYRATPSPAQPMDYAYAHAIESEDGSIVFSSSTGNGIAVDPNGAFVHVGGSALYAEDQDVFGYKVDGRTGRYCGSPLCYVFTTPPNLGDDTFASIALDEAGETYFSGTLVVEGTTPYAFVGKVNATGTDSPWAVIFTDTDHGYGIAFDGANIYASGSANDQGTLDAFVVKLDPTGEYLDGTTLDGSGDDIAYSVAYDASSGTAYLAGATTSPDISTDGSQLAGLRDGFLASVGVWL